ncbi:hypothetical protein Si077_00860 [Streptococcus infantarius subsp. infantarius]|nr:hypothetical protein [Streptococcus infantarius subsp. infantarius]
MVPKFRFFGKVADGEMRMVLAESIDFKNGFVYYSYNEYTVEGDEHVYGDLIGFEDCVLMQSTGLFDKNGVEIYEGDIVRYECCFESYVEEVIYDDKHCNFGTIDKDEKTFSFDALISDFDVDCFEVVGNKYENPELLKGE